MNLSEHFSEEELGVASADLRVKSNARHFCETILEPIRAKFGPLRITSAYRPPQHNQLVGGVNNSEHEYRDDHAAADFQPFGNDVPLTQIFNWIRLESGLRFRQVILEHDHATQAPSCIHISSRAGALDKHEALVGGTHGTEPYQKVEAN